jgi:hypothetical protein
MGQKQNSASLVATSALHTVADAYRRHPGSRPDTDDLRRYRYASAGAALCATWKTAHLVRPSNTAKGAFRAGAER